jgi:hypothetical protein
MSKLTLEDAISHCLEVAEQNETQADKWQEEGGEQWGKTTACRECAADHRQLAEWLTDYKELKNSIGAAKFSNMKEALELIREYKAENIAQKKLIAEYKRLLKAALEDIVWLNEHTVDGEGRCLIETATDMETCLACPLNVNNSHICGWKHQVEALALIGEDGDTNG